MNARCSKTKQQPLVWYRVKCFPIQDNLRWNTNRVVNTSGLNCRNKAFVLGARTQESCSTCHLKKPKVTVGRGCGEEPPALRAPAGPSDNSKVKSPMSAEGPSPTMVGASISDGRGSTTDGGGRGETSKAKLGHQPWSCWGRVSGEWNRSLLEGRRAGGTGDIQSTAMARVRWGGQEGFLSFRSGSGTTQTCQHSESKAGSGDVVVWGMLLIQEGGGGKEK